MAAKSTPSSISDPVGQFPLHSLTAHEIIQIADRLSAPDHGLLLLSNASHEDHLEPWKFWKIPFRGAEIVVMRGSMTGLWDIDFEGFGREGAAEFLRQTVKDITRSVGAADIHVLRNLQTCDNNGCPGGHVNYN